MRLQHSHLILLLLVALVLASCSQPADYTSETGSLIIRIQEKSLSRTIMPEQESMFIQSYRIVGYLNSVKSIEEDFSSSTLELNSLKAGEWKFEIYGINGSTIVASTGEQTVIISPAQTTSKVFELNYLEVSGTGKFSYDIAIPESNNEIDRFVLSFQNLSDDQQTVDDIVVYNTAAASEGYRTYSSFTDLPIGNYLLTVSLYNNEGTLIGIISKESLYILNGRESIYTKNLKYMGKVETPVISQASGIVDKGSSISISCGTDDSEIYYTTDGSDPLFGKLYSGPVQIEKNTTIRAIAIAKYMFNSEEVSCEYHVVLDSNFTISPRAGTYNDGEIVSITSANRGKLYYSIDDGTYEEYNDDDKIVLSHNCSLNVYETKEGFDQSPVKSQNYVIQVLTPQFSVSSGVYTEVQTVSISSSTDSTIYYTDDGSEPTTLNGKVYNAQLVIDKTTTLRAIAVKNNMLQSEESQVDLQINGLLNLTLVAPQLKTLTIKHPDSWGESIPTVVPGVSAVLEAELSSDQSEGIEYKWFLDGNEVSNGKKLALGTASQNVCLGAGHHIITCVATDNNNTYSADYELNASRKNGIGVEGPTYLIGSLGPAGGYIFYDCDADNTTEDPDGPDDLRSDECGWRYMETTTCLSSFPFGVIYDENDERITVGTKQAIGTGKENTDLFVEAINTYRVKNYYDLAEYSNNINRLAPIYISEYELNGYTDWFIPSYDELYAIYEAYYNDPFNFGGGYKNFIVTTNRYIWSSTEDGASSMMSQAFFTSQMVSRSRHTNNNATFVFAVRRFL